MWKFYYEKPDFDETGTAIWMTAIEQVLKERVLPPPVPDESIKKLVAKRKSSLKYRIGKFKHTHQEKIERIFSGVFGLTAVLFLLQGPMNDYFIWKQAQDTEDYYGYLQGIESYYNSHRYIVRIDRSGYFSGKAKDNILEHANVAITVQQRFTNMRRFVVFDYDLPIEELLRDLALQLRLRDVKIGVVLRGEGIDANYRGSGVMTTGAALQGRITLTSADGFRTEILNIDYRSEPLTSAKAVWGHANRAFENIFERDVKPAVTAIVKAW